MCKQDLEKLSLWCCESFQAEHGTSMTSCSLFVIIRVCDYSGGAADSRLFDRKLLCSGQT